MGGGLEALHARIAGRFARAERWGRLGTGHLGHLHGLLAVGIMSVTNLTSTSLWAEVVTTGAAVSLPWLRAASNTTASKTSRRRRLLGNVLLSSGSKQQAVALAYVR